MGFFRLFYIVWVSFSGFISYCTSFYWPLHQSFHRLWLRNTVNFRFIAAHWISIICCLFQSGDRVQYKHSKFESCLCHSLRFHFLVFKELKAEMSARKASYNLRDDDSDDDQIKSEKKKNAMKSVSQLLYWLVVEISATLQRSSSSNFLRIISYSQLLYEWFKL